MQIQIVHSVPLAVVRRQAPYAELATPAADDVGRMLYRLAFDEAIGGCDLQEGLFVIDDGIDLAHQGICSLDEARAEIVRVVGRHRAAAVD